MNGRQVIRQPDGKLAVFSEGVDRWLRWDMTADEAIEWFAAQAAAEARKSAQHTVHAVLAGHPEEVYCDFAVTFAEANAHSQHSGGEVLEGPVDADLLAELERPLLDADA